MKDLLPKLILMVFVIALVGCAAKTEVATDPVEPVVTDTRKVIELECKSANKLGCRQKGYIYPWNAWLDEKGYDAKDYELKDVVFEGSRATVVIMER